MQGEFFMLYDESIYMKFLESKTKKQWEKIGIKRRAGVLVPLFSIYSSNSIGIGDVYDIKLIADWCKKCNFSIIQLLPLNDTFYKFTPYDCISTFALDPIYLNLFNLKIPDIKKFLPVIYKLKENFTIKKRVDYGIKKEKLKILWNIYESLEKIPEEFADFVDKNNFWINDYAIFSVLKEKNNEKSWEDWEEEFKNKNGKKIEKFQQENFDRINFYRWLQWQIYLQFKEVKEYVNKKGVFIFGDLPFLVSRDSADVWANKEFFKMDLAAGAPPDMYFAKGQRWGMPPYNWEKIEEKNYIYLKEKLKYAENFYDMFRIDHFVGLFRVWTIKRDEPENTYGLNGVFDPADESKWEEHGKKIINVMIETTEMLPCAEDLGVVPACSFKTLKEFSITGMDVQRWMRDWGKTYEFKKVDEYRENSIAVVSTHDMTPLITWWENEAGSVDILLIEKICEEHKFDFNFILNNLFDYKDEKKNRLIWKKHIDNPEQVLKTLGKSRADGWMFYDLHREIYDEKQKFLKFLGEGNLDIKKVTYEFVKSALLKVGETKSIFSIQNIFDLLSLGSYFKNWDKWDLRINTPGIISEKNWNIVIPVSLDELLKADINDEILNMNKKTERI
jgi:4-alpha-glucanotransferase